MILFIYIKYVLALCGLIIFAIFLFSPKRSIFNLKRLKGKQLKFAKKHGKTVNIIARVMCVIVLVVALPMRIIPLTLDIPAAITSNYEEATVEVVRNDIGNPERLKQRDITVKNTKTGDEYTIHVYAKQIQQGEILKIEILPFSKFGEIIEKANT